MKTAVREQVNAMTGAVTQALAELLKTIRPRLRTRDGGQTCKDRHLPGKDFDATKLEPAVAKGIAGRPGPRRT